jgi:hypothetical protein
VALINTGKPIISLHGVRLVQFLLEVGRAFPRVARRPGAASPRIERADRSSSA